MLREPGQNKLVEQRLVRVGSDHFTIRNKNDYTLFSIARQNAQDIITSAVAFKKGLTCTFLSASDTGKSVGYLLLQWSSSTAVVKSFLPKNVSFA
jgi:hypothetical protein